MLECSAGHAPQFTEAVVNLKYDEEPKYEAYMRLFEQLCGPKATRPIHTIVPAPKVGQKRQRDPNDEILLDSTGAPKKKARASFALPQPLLPPSPPAFTRADAPTNL